MYGYHYDWLERHADRTPDKLALVDLNTSRRFTYRAVNERANRFASFLQVRLGVRVGGRVSILAKNSTEYFEILFGCSKTGAVLNTLNWRLALPELEFILHDFSPEVLIYDSEFDPVVRKLKPKLGACQTYINIGKEVDRDTWVYEKALREGSLLGVPLPRLKYEDTWALLYTSGTTGEPKGAKMTYGNFFYNAVGIGQALDINSRDVNLTYLPCFHAGGLGLYACPVLHAGGTVVVGRDFNAVEMLRNIERWKSTIMILVPSMYLMLDQIPELDEFDLSSMRAWTSGGSHLPPNLVHNFKKKRDIIIRQGYGMTESGPSVFLIPEEDAVRKAGSVGKVVLHSDVCIMDGKGRKLGPNKVGELCVRGNITSGYWNREDITAETIVDGWLHTGDAAKYDEEGFYYIVDRIKDMFISGGENVYPAEIEEVIYKIPAIKEVAVIGVPDPKWQEVPKAVVVLKEDTSASEEEIISFCSDKLAKYKIPRSVAFVKALPRNDTGKVLKRELVKLHKEFQESPFNRGRNWA
jgi:fatty-acyl-CoA synthase